MPQPPARVRAQNLHTVNRKVIFGSYSWEKFRCLFAANVANCKLIQACKYQCFQQYMHRSYESKSNAAHVLILNYSLIRARGARINASWLKAHCF